MNLTDKACKAHAVDQLAAKACWTGCFKLVLSQIEWFECVIYGFLGQSMGSARAD